jgi:RHH-type transcriptional regulator, rel operon repressor / antitoxin RelB
LIQGIDSVAEHEHSSRSGVIRQAIVRFLEDREDIILAKQAKLNMKSRKPLLQLRKELDLVD